MQGVALVTGCSAGSIGFALCQSLLKRDYIVYATSRSLDSMKGLDHACVKKLILDVTDDHNVQDVVDTIMKEQGQIDLLINNVGILAPGPIIDHTTEQVKEIFDTNVFSIVRLSRAVIPHMAVRKQGTIVNMGSIVGEYPTPWMGIYDSSKAAVKILTEVLSLECRPFNIRVMLVAPAVIQSTMLGKFDSFSLPYDTLYADYAHNVRDRLDAAQGKDAMPLTDFSEEIISKATKATPPAYVLTGGRANLFRVMAWLPRWLVLNIVWGMFSKPKVNAKQECFCLH